MNILNAAISDKIIYQWHYAYVYLTRYFLYLKMELIFVSRNYTIDMIYSRTITNQIQQPPPLPQTRRDRNSCFSLEKRNIFFTNVYAYSDIGYTNNKCVQWS